MYLSDVKVVRWWNDFESRTGVALLVSLRGIFMCRLRAWLRRCFVVIQRERAVGADDEVSLQCDQSHRTSRPPGSSDYLVGFEVTEVLHCSKAQSTSFLA